MPAGRARKQGKIGRNLELREFVQEISRVLRLRFPDREMHVVHETIYQALYVQGLAHPGRAPRKAPGDGRLITATRRPPECASRRWEVSPPTT